jgi:hypothetical protein
MTLPSPRITAVFAAAIAIVAAAAAGSGPSTSAQTDPTVSVDTDPYTSPANTASLVGSIEPCRSVPSGSGSLDVDITIQGVASLSGIEADIFYNPAVLNVTGMQDNFMLAGGTLFNLSDLLPDSDGTFRMLLGTTGEGSGDGVIVRLTLQPVADGASSLDLANVELRDFDGNPVLPAAVQDGGIAVGTSCGAPDPDTDGDGFSDGDEAFIGTLPMASCPATDAADDENPDAWPPDFDDNQVVNIVDLNKILPAPLGHWGETPASPGWSPRYDIVPDGVINILDLNKMLPAPLGFWGESCT